MICLSATEWCHQDSTVFALVVSPSANLRVVVPSDARKSYGYPLAAYLGFASSLEEQQLRLIPHEHVLSLDDAYKLQREIHRHTLLTGAR